MFRLPIARPVSWLAAITIVSSSFHIDYHSDIAIDSYGSPILGALSHGLIMSFGEFSRSESNARSWVSWVARPNGARAGRCAWLLRIWEFYGSGQSWLIRGIIPKWPYFRLVNYCNLPRWMILMSFFGNPKVWNWAKSVWTIAALLTFSILLGCTITMVEGSESGI